MTEIQTTVQWVLGLVAVGVYINMSYATLSPDVTLSTPVIVGMLLLIALLLFGIDQSEGLIDSLRGTRFELPEDDGNGGDDG